MEIIDNYQSDFEEFLADEYEVKDGGKIISADTANYYIKRIKSNNDDKKRYEQTAKELKEKYIEKLNLWLERRLQVLDNDNQHCSQLLEEYYHECQDDNSKKIKLPNGSIGFYKNRDSIDFDSDALLDFVQGDVDMQKYLVLKPSVDTKTLRKDSNYTEVKDAEGNSSIQLKVGETVIPPDIATVNIGTSVFAVK